MSETVKISVRNLVEFILREGDIDQRRTAGADKEQMQLGARIHRKIQRQMGSDYHAEVPLKMEVLCEGFTLCLEGRADGIIKREDEIVIDEIKGCLLYTSERFWNKYTSNTSEQTQRHSRRTICAR